MFSRSAVLNFTGNKLALSFIAHELLGWARRTKLTQVRQNILAPLIPLAGQCALRPTSTTWISIFGGGCHHLTDTVFVHSKQTICPMLKPSFPHFHNTILYILNWTCVQKANIAHVAVPKLNTISLLCNLIVLPCSKYCHTSLVPRPRPAFHHLQYGKAGRAWYLFSCEHDAISKLRKFAELTGYVSRIFNWLRAQRSVCKTIASR